MDMAYGTTSVGFVLQAIDNSGQGRTQPWQTPEGWRITQSIEEPAMGGKFVILKNAESNVVMLVPMGTNGNDDSKGWYANFKDFGLSQWRSTATDEQGRTIKDRVYAALDAELEGGAALLCAGDSKGGAQCQFIVRDIVADREANAQTGLGQLAALENSQIGLVGRSMPGGETALKAEDSDYNPYGSEYRGITVDYSATRWWDGSKTELITQTGGGLLGNFDKRINYLSEGVGVDAAQVGQNANDWAYLHRLVYAGYDGMTALNGDFSRRTADVRETMSANELIAIGGAVGGMGQGSGVNSFEAKLRMGTAAVCGLVMSPLAAAQGATNGELGIQTVVGLGMLPVLANPVGLSLVKACAVGVAGSNGAKYLGDSSGGARTATDQDLAFAVGSVHAPQDIPEDATRLFGRTATGGLYVLDIKQDNSGGQFYCLEQGVRTNGVIAGQSIDFEQFDNASGGALRHGAFTCSAGVFNLKTTDTDGNPVREEIGRLSADNASILETKEWASDHALQSDTLMAVSADSKTTSVSRDLDGDGSFDRKETYKDTNLDGVADQSSIETADGNTAFYDGAGASLGRMQTLDGQPAATPLPTSTSASSSLNYSEEVFSSQRDFALCAQGVRAFVCLDGPSDDDIPADGSGLTEALYDWFVAIDALAGSDEDNDLGGYYDDWGQTITIREPLASLDFFVWNEQDSGWNYSNAAEEWQAGSDSTLVSANYSNFQYYLSNDSWNFFFSIPVFSFGPVALDLDGDGVELVADNASQAWYDLIGDGSRVHTGWVGADDALLAIDENGDNEISSGREIAFSQYTEDDKTDTDMEALATVFDTNSDGALDAQDTRFGDFRIWQDGNGNGESDENEVLTLEEAGITSVNLVPKKVDYESGGNRILGFSSFTKADGSSGWAADVAFGFEGEGYSSSQENGYLRVSQSQGDAYAVGTGGALNLEMAANHLEGALGSTAADCLFAGNLETGVLIEGGAGNDTLNGGVGDDWLAGGAGSDTLQAGVGNDTLLIDSADLQANVDGGDGFDSALVNGATGVSLDLGAAHIESAVGGDGADVFSTTGTARVILAGGGGNDSLTGGDGSDLLTGGAGNDALAGRLGSDLYVYVRGSGVDTVNDTGGLDTVEFGQGITLAELDAEFAGADLMLGLRDWVTDSGTVAGLVERIVLKNWTNLNLRVEQVRFADGTLENISTWKVGTTANNTLTGAETDDRLYGGAGDDSLDGGLGADKMFGGLGNDSYVVDDEHDMVLEFVNGGADTVRSSVDLTLSVNVENLILQGPNEVDGKGNALDNALTGNSVANMLTGLDGADTLDGGTGADTLIGGQGNDTYVVDDVDDCVIELANEGSDSVQSSVSYTLADHVENLALTGTGLVNGFGNALDNTLSGNSAANVLAGAGGNDTYIVDSAQDTILELADEGYDTVRSSIALTLAENIENLTLTGAAAVSGTGNALDNVLTGNSAANTLTGAGGNDILDGGAGADTMVGGVGSDIYFVDNTSDQVTELADEGNDTVRSAITYTLGAALEHLVLSGTAAINGTGNALDNVLVGNSAGNTLNGGAGADSMYGSAGDDVYMVDSISDTFSELANEGTDTVQSSVTCTLSDNVENLILTGTAAIDGTGNALSNILSGNAAANTLLGGEGDDSINGGASADTMSGGAGDDTYTVDIATDVAIEAANEGTDTVLSGVTLTLADNIENLTLTGTTAIHGTGNTLDNVLTGNSAANTLTGGAGNDTMIGGAGNDTMIGGAGNDVYFVDAAGDVVTESADEGTDTVQTGVTYTLSANFENLSLTGTAAIAGTGNMLDNMLIGNSANNSLSGGAGNDILDGGLGNDTMSGGLGNDIYYVNSTSDAASEAVDEGADMVYASATFTLGANVENLTLVGTTAINGTGNTSNNILIGNGANNTLSGGTGADTMNGGGGNDTYVVDNAGDVVIENAAEGTDLVQSSVAFILVAEIENLTLTGSVAISGTGNELDNAITGNAGANALYGHAGNDVLDGAAGNDTMTGGLGDDTYKVNAAGDVVVELADEGTDTVFSSDNYTLAANVENLSLIGSASTGTGNACDNLVVGNELGNTLNGMDGNDLLDGGTGVDALNGGLGDDTYVIDVTSWLVETYGADEWGNPYVVSSYTESSFDIVNEAANAGTDTVIVSLTYTLGTNIENLTLVGSEVVNGTGNALDNVLTGNNANNVLNGGIGSDRLQGGRGNDTYVVDNAGDVVVESADEGTDLVQSSASFNLSGNVENLTLTGTASINGTGNALGNILIGNNGANTLTGNAGKDTLSGGAGADTLIGGTDDDAYLVDNIGDVVIEYLAEGTDIVQSSVSFTLSANLENLTLAGTAAISGTGTELDNVITGNGAANALYGLAGNDVIIGGAGGDTMVGGTGNDRYYVDSAYDVITELENEGIDTALAAATHTLSANVENLTLTGKTAINGAGNELDNFINGNIANNILTGYAGADTLNGGAGSDTMRGGLGNDTYYVDISTDVVTELANEGLDSVSSSATYTLAVNVENLTLLGVAAVNGTGNALDNVLIGNVSKNTLDGKAGADSMEGGQGSDTYVVDNAADIVIENADEGLDLIQAYITYTLAAGNNVEGLTLMGTVLSGTGNELDNVLTGNASANTLIGLAGSDTLDGKTGADIMTGGTGDDTYIVDNVGDVVIETEGEGIDAIESSITRTLADNVENLILTGTGAITGNGNALDNVLIGNAAANYLYGFGGNDTLDGGTGNDKMFGGLGNDTYYVNATGDTVTETAGEGADHVISTATYTLSGTSEIENLTLAGTAIINGTGNALDNTLVGNLAANLLDGGIGADRMEGGLGSDTYMVDNVGDVIIERRGEGVDLVKSSVTYVLADHVEKLALIGNAVINGTGNVLDNEISGNTADNVLNGMGGDDKLIGGAGNDTYYVDSITDAITEKATQGYDTVYSSTSYILSANVEKLVLSGTASLSGTGNAVANVLTGNSGANRLDGLGGADSMTGCAGDDSYVVDNAGDVVTEYFGEGMDAVESTVSFTLSDNLENLFLSGKNAVNGTGNALDNLLTGNIANNILSGGDGNDILYGGAGGNDTLTGGNGNDNFIISRIASLVASITDFVQGTDTIGLGQSAYGGLFEEGALRAGVFSNGTAATTSEQRLFYNMATGGLFFDQDGNGTTAAVQIATLGNKPSALSSNDFVLAMGA